jgi:adenosylhomocysteine nucleosidase
VGQPRAAIVAALPREMAALVRGVPAERALLAEGIHLYRLPNAIAVAAGMGSARATIAVQAALRAASSIEMLVSTGLAGACSAELAPGEVAEAGLVIDVRTGERFATDAAGRAHRTLVTAERISNVAEKARLAASYGASLVDMEAATVARLAQAHGLRFRAIKGVSDAHDFELQALGRFAGRRGEFRTAAFALHTALHPAEWKSAVRLGRDSSRALQALMVQLRVIAFGG